MTDLVERTRRAVLAWFNADGGYTAIFTQNATAALKHVGESYPFGPRGRCLLSVDNHNSVNGIREFAAAKGAAVAYVPLTTPELRIDRDRLRELLDEASPSADNLFAFPAQSNFSGVKHPLEIIDEAHDRGWDVLLDAAAFVPTSRLDLSAVRPDFVSISFYKMFGYPTGCRVSPGAQDRASKAAATVVCGWHGQLRQRGGPLPHPRARRGGLRRRHAQLPGDPRRRDWPPAPRRRRHRHDSGARAVPDRVAASIAPRAAGTATAAPWCAFTGR